MFGRIDGLYSQYQIYEAVNEEKNNAEYILCVKFNPR